MTHPIIRPVSAFHHIQAICPNLLRETLAQGRAEVSLPLAFFHMAQPPRAHSTVCGAITLTDGTDNMLVIVKDFTPMADGQTCIARLYDPTPRLGQKAAAKPTVPTWCCK